MRRLSRSFFDRPTLEVAPALLGKHLVHHVTPEIRLIGRIAEVEAYLDDDPASHSFRGLTPRNAPMFGPPGMSYVYFIYGMYFCFNIVTEKKGKAGAVLIRAVQPLEGIEWMQSQRGHAPLKSLANGPGKLCQAMGITKAYNGLDLCTREAKLYVVDAPVVPLLEILTGPRIGIKDAKHQPWRFWLP
jgi:DNA-3-methyladenine glycosylase